MTTTISMALTLPKCPVCAADACRYIRTPAQPSEGEPRCRRAVEFRCGLLLHSTAARDFTNSWEPYDEWTSWEIRQQCSKAMEIALRLASATPSAKLT